MPIKTMEINAIYEGDNLDILSKFPSESVDFIYADPPFFSNKHYEVIWEDGAEIRAFQDRWKGGIENYIAWMALRLNECHRVLKKTGSMYLHCDYHANSHLRILMDKIFGENHFRSEIIWSYFGPTASKKNYPRKHDTIYFYTKSNDYYFNQDAILEAYDDKAIKRYDKIDKDGKRYKLYFEKDGKVRKAYMKKGTPTEIFYIPFIQGTADERLGYPTQKPVALLEKFIGASTKETGGGRHSFRPFLWMRNGTRSRSKAS